MGKVICHTDVDYEQELKSLLTFSAQTDCSTEHLTSLVHRFFINKYGEENVHLDALHIEVSIVCKDPSISYLWFGNLYSYVLLSGVCMPYCDWIYENRYYGEDYIYEYDTSGLPKKMKLKPLVPIEAVEQMDVMRKRIKSLEQQLVKLEPLRKKHEAVGNIIASLQAPAQIVLKQLKLINKQPGIELGDICNRDGCDGELIVGKYGSTCSCHTTSMPPCSHCTTTSCTTCDFVHQA